MIVCICNKLKSDVRDFESWKKKRIATDDKVLAGEPIFKGTRLAVRKIGKMVENGLTDEIKEDYPYLTDEDLRFAPILVELLIDENLSPKGGNTGQKIL